MGGTLITAEATDNKEKIGQKYKVREVVSRARKPKPARQQHQHRRGGGLVPERELADCGPQAKASHRPLL